MKTIKSIFTWTAAILSFTLTMFSMFEAVKEKEKIQSGLKTEMK